MHFHFDIKSTTFLLFFISLSLLAVINYFAVELFLYWQYLWLDIPMHFLGGIVAALGFLSFVSGYQYETFMRGMGATLVFVLLIGLLWEAFEFTIGVPVIARESVAQDTTLDLVMDLFGGVVGYTVARALQPLDEVSEDAEDSYVR